MHFKISSKMNAFGRIYMIPKVCHIEIQQSLKLRKYTYSMQKSKKAKTECVNIC